MSWTTAVTSSSSMENKTNRKNQRPVLNRDPSAVHSPVSSTTRVQLLRTILTARLGLSCEIIDQEFVSGATRETRGEREEQLSGSERVQCPDQQQRQRSRKRRQQVSSLEAVVALLGHLSRSQGCLYRETVEEVRG